VRIISKVFVALFAVLAIGLVVAAPAAQATDTDQSVAGTLRFDGDPVEGVTVTVTDAGGSVVDSTASDADGQWHVPVPGAGDYTVTLDTSTLPDGVFATRGDTRELTVITGRSSNALFPLGTSAEVVEESPATEDDPAAPDDDDEPATDDPTVPDAAADPEEEVEVATGRGTLSRVVGHVYSGIHLGLIIALAALGLSLIFGTTGLINFAHGELVSFGALAAVVFHVIGVGGFQLPLLIATPAAVALGVLFGYAQERWFWGWLRHRGTGLLAMMIISIGVALLLRNVYQYYFGSRRQLYRDFATQSPIEIGPLLVVPRNLIVDAVAIVVLLSVVFALIYSRFGKATRAVADNPALASASGINVDRVIRLVWATGGGLAALAGIFLAMSEGASFIAGFQILLLLFAAVIVGGLGTAFGAVVGGLIVGLFVQVSTLWIPGEFKYVAALVLLIVVLLFRPQGLLGRQVRVG
jgi:neutral amino acid transport system permease protein